MDALDFVKSHLKGKVVILGIGNRLRSDDSIGSKLAANIKGKVTFRVFDAEESPENYLEKVVKENPDNIILVDAGDVGLKPGEFHVFEANQVEVTNFFSTHNASLYLTINYLQTNTKADIIIFIIQPKKASFGEELSPELTQTLKRLEVFFYETGKEKG